MYLLYYIYFKCIACLIIIISNLQIMQQNNVGNVYDQLHAMFQNEIKQLMDFNENALKPLAHFTYPLRSLTIYYEKIQKKIKMRKEKSKNIIISDIFYMSGPDLLITVDSIKKYIDNFDEQRNNTQIAAIAKNYKLEGRGQTQLLLMPFKFLQQSMISQLLKITSGKIQSTDQKRLKQFIVWYQKSNLLERIEQSVVQPADLKKSLILSQYPLPAIKNKLIQAKFGLKCYFIYKLKKRAATAEQNCHKRKMKILQLVDGQKKYISGLKDYIQYIKRPIEKLNILSIDETKKIFSTIQQIKQFHVALYKDLNDRYEQHHKYQTYGDIIKKLLPYFKLYIQYILNVNQGAQTDFMNLENRYQQIAEICSIYLAEKEKKASDYLTQPTFRIARYQALFGQIIRKTNQLHPDYTKMQQVLKGFQQILGGVNKTVDKIIRKNRLHQLNEQFGTEQYPLFDQNRQFLNEYNLFMVRQDKLETVILFIFSDLLLIIDENSRKILKRVPVDNKYYVRRQQDSKIYKNIFKVHHEGYIFFTAGNQERHLKKIQEIFHLLESISLEGQGSETMVYVQCLGTQEIGSTSFAKHTQYVIQIKYLGLKKYLHLRFSDVSKIVKQMQCQYKDCLGITDEESLKKTWFNNHKSKTIEDRKRTIQQILQKIFNYQLIRNNPGPLLKILDISTDFFLTARKSSLKSIQLSQSIYQTKVTKRQQKEALFILCATEIMLGRDVYHDTQQLYKKQQQDLKRITILVKTMADEKPIQVVINEEYTVQDVCNKVSKLIGLRTNRDFRLFHEIGKKQLRVLDHEQHIMKIFKFPDKPQHAVEGLFSQMASSLNKIFSPYTHPTLIFKKYYFLPFQIEQSQYKKDLTRLRLITYQVFSEIKQMKYQLVFDEYLLFAALLIYIECDGDTGRQIGTNILYRIIPETIFKLKNYTQQQWMDRIRPHIARLSQEVQKIITYNQTQVQTNSRIKLDTVSKTALYFGPRHLASQIVLNKIKSNQIYGSNLFYVQPYKTTYENLIKSGKKVAYNMWLAIKFQSLTLLTPSQKQAVIELHYKDIDKPLVYADAIVFKMDEVLNTQYRFNTYQSFQISQLVKYNKALNKVLADLKKNSKLVSQTKHYKQQLLEYRSTYENVEKGQIKF